MHEYPLTKQIIQIAEEHAKEQKAKRVTQINLVVGEYSGIVADCVQLYFDLIAEGTLCEGAELQIEKVTPLLKCTKCGHRFERKPFSFQCTAEGCDGEGEPTEVGREFYVKSIEVEACS